MIHKFLIILGFIFFFVTPTLAQSTAPYNELKDEDPRIKIVASFTILADMIQQIGGEHVDINTLIGIKDPVHDFQPSPKDGEFIAGAEIIAINGLSFEGWIHRFIKSSGTKAKLLVATAGMPVIWHDEGGQKSPDPHAWLSLRNAKIYTKNITHALSNARPELKDTFVKNARTYLEKINKLHKKTDLKFKLLSSKKRKIITNHDAFGYFARDYDLTVKSITGLNDHDEPSPKDIANLILYIQKEDVKAIFMEDNHDNRLMQQIAQDTGVHIGMPLYTGSLTIEDGEAPTYLKMMETNINRIYKAIK